MQNGIQPRPVTAQTPNAQPLDPKKLVKNQLLASLYSQRGEGEKKKCIVEQKSKKSQTDRTHYVYPPDTFLVLLTVLCPHAGHWTGTGESQKGTR